MRVPEGRARVSVVAEARFPRATEDADPFGRPVESLVSTNCATAQLSIDGQRAFLGGAG